MAIADLSALEAYMREPEMQRQTVVYLTEQMKQFIKPRERVLLCFPGDQSMIIADLMERAVESIGAEPLRWGPDFRWKTLLKLAFSSRATAFIGFPNVALGLMKLAKATATPLYIRNVLTVGYPCMKWMIDGIRKGLDCISWGCFNPGNGAVVAGFSCGSDQGVHLRDDLFMMQVLNQDGEPAAEGKIGELALIMKSMPDQLFITHEMGRVTSAHCHCGKHRTQISDFSIISGIDPTVAEIYEQLHAWTSILDCRVWKGPYGLELEIVKFSGEKLPQLPHSARLILRSWNPELDVPFSPLNDLKNSDLSWESY